MNTPAWGQRLIYFDGGMGTMLQAAGLAPGEKPARWNLTRPDAVRAVHAAYLAAGCDIVTANTFGASPLQAGGDSGALIAAGVRIAREAAAARGLVAFDAGPLGRLLAPLGDLAFETAVDQYRQMARDALLAGADALLAETMTDLAECRAAVLGFRAAIADTGLPRPIWVSLAVDKGGRLLTGADVRCAAATLCALRVDALGLNCGDAPDQLLPALAALLACCPAPVFFQPNASLPVIENSRTVFPTDPDAFALSMRAAAELGAWGLGGCCGTTPAHIARVVAETRACPPAPRAVPDECVLAGRTDTLVLGGAPALIGERLNPTGKKRMKQALRDNDIDFLLKEALAQMDAGADALDVNVGLPEIDEAATLPRVVAAVQSVCGAPLQLDTADASALAASLRLYCGRALVNSVCGKRESLDTVLPLAREYGCAVVCLLLDENGVPETVEGRLAIADLILSAAERCGVPKRDLIFDALTLTVSADPAAARVTLDTVRRLTREYGVKTVLGASNVSFGLPQRPLLTGAFLAMAVREGLSAAIMNPLDPVAKGLWDASRALLQMDEGFARYLSAYANAPALAPAAGASAAPVSADAPAPADPLRALADSLRRGLAGDAGRAAETLLASGADALSLVDGAILPALNDVGERYEKGAFFLPQLLQSASAAQAAFDALRCALPAREGGGVPVVLATVRGDVHDIGKNIVSALLGNYGFQVIDLGKDVPPERVLAAVRQSGARLVGLSALMTTTVPAMRETLALLRREAPDVRAIVGGAVLTEELARSLGADGYGRDAMATVRFCQANA